MTGFLLRKLPFLPAFVLFATVVLGVASQFFIGRGWDIDQRMYFGGRLANGEFHWTIEFDDKLPVIQLLFLLPAYLKSIRVWQAMSLVAIGSACAALFIFLRSSLRSYFPSLEDREASAVSIYAAILFIFMFVFLNGGISHFSAMAASLATLAVLSADLAWRYRTQGRRNHWIVFLVGAFFGSVAIGIRPQFLLPLVLAGAWATVRNSPATSDAQAGQRSGMTTPSLRHALFWSAGWIFCTGVFGLIVNASPYAFMGKMGALLAGSSMLSQALNPQSLRGTIGSQIESVRFAALISKFVMAGGLLGLTVLVAGYLRCGRNGRPKYQRKLVIDVVVLAMLFPLLLEVTILKTHFWPNYLQMFVPFAVFSFAVSIALMTKAGMFSISRKRLIEVALVGSLIIGVAAKGVIISSANDVRLRSIDSDHPQRQLAIFQQFRDRLPDDRRDFLNPSHMYFHWQVGEPRHGFPHAANINQIVEGWWTNVSLPDHFDLPRNLEELCAMLETRGPSIVVELKETDVVHCFFAERHSVYSRVELPQAGGSSEMLIYMRGD